MTNLRLLDPSGKRVLISGNEAIARGCIEAGVGFASCYPGTPSSEITDTLYELADKTGMYVEYSTNEKVAVEAAAGAAITGVRSIASMKHVGLNVAADALITLAYVGVRSGCVVVSADDPECWSSQNEQDNRYYAQLAGIPCLEPSDAQEAKDMTVEAFKLSERLELPIIIRTTTRVNHTHSPVTLGGIEKRTGKSKFSKEPKRFVMIPSNALPRHDVLLKKKKEGEQISETTRFNKIVRQGHDIGVIASGAAFNYSMEAVQRLNLKASVLKLGFVHPLPSKLVLDFIMGLRRIFVVEELEPFLENAVRSIAFGNSNSPQVFGKLTEHFPRSGEFSTRIVCEGFSKELGKDLLKPIPQSGNVELSFEIPPRPPVLCPGCSHRASFYIMKKTLRTSPVYCTDIGCYALGVQPPLAIGDLLICMGASIGVACGVSQTQDEPVLSIIGDSTFLHAGIPALINAASNNHRVITVVLDNLTTAMTGFQPHPGSIDPKRRGSRVSIEEVARGCGIKNVKVIDPFKMKETEQIFEEAYAHPGPSLIVLRRICSTLDVRRHGKKPSYQIVDEKCIGCKACIKTFGCPAIHVENDRVKIDSVLCTGCGFCVHLCPSDAIRQVQTPYCVVEEMCVGCEACTEGSGCPAIAMKNGKAQIDDTLCSGCGLCVELCPAKAIEQTK